MPVAKAARPESYPKHPQRSEWSKTSFLLSGKEGLWGTPNCDKQFVILSCSSHLSWFYHLIYRISCSCGKIYGNIHRLKHVAGGIERRSRKNCSQKPSLVESTLSRLWSPHRNLTVRLWKILLCAGMRLFVPKPGPRRKYSLGSTNLEVRIKKWKSSDTSPP